MPRCNSPLSTLSCICFLSSPTLPLHQTHYHLTANHAQRFVPSPFGAMFFTRGLHTPFHYAACCHLTRAAVQRLFLPFPLTLASLPRLKHLLAHCDLLCLDTTWLPYSPSCSFASAGRGLDINSLAGPVLTVGRRSFSTRRAGLPLSLYSRGRTGPQRRSARTRCATRTRTPPPALALLADMTVFRSTTRWRALHLPTHLLTVTRALSAL